MAFEPFGERLMESIRAKRSHVVVGLDPDYGSIPEEVRAVHRREEYGNELEMKAACYREFLGGILDAVCEDAVAVKVQLAYFEALGSCGYRVYEEMVGAAQERGLLAIADAKRGDIGSTAEAYAQAHLDCAGANALTVNPYLGTDSVEPFLKRARDNGRGVFILVKTSNPGSADLQDLELATGERLYVKVGGLVSGWGEATRGPSGYSSIGAVVGATHPKVGAELRHLMPTTPFLVPGYGAQGADANDLEGFFDDDGLGAVVNSSRALLYAYRQKPEVSWQEATRRETKAMKAALWRAAGLE